MASLSFIMDVTDDRRTDRRPPVNKRDKGVSNLASAGPLHEPPTRDPQEDPRHVTGSPGPDPTKQDIKQAAPSGRTKRRGASSRGPRSAAAVSKAETGAPATVSPAPSTSPSLSAPTARQSTRRRSTTSNDSMDRPRYGSAASLSSIGGGLQRPVQPRPAAAQFPARITPKTGRVSKAKKGLPVHICDICRPPKPFTRAEHLRRHQLGHGAPQFQCPGCDRSFHRPDLLARHQQKHEHEGDGPSKPESTRQSPHPSQPTLTFQAQHSPRTPGPAPAPSPVATEVPPIPATAAGRQPDFSQLGNAAHGSGSIRRAATWVSSQDFRGAYTLSPTLSVVNPGQPSSLAASYRDDLEEYQPRAGQPSIYVVTRDLPLPSPQQPELPELHDVPSSASDSPYSTPVSDAPRYPRPWVRGRPSPTADWTSTQRLSPYPGAAPRGLRTAGQGIEEIPVLQPPVYVGSFSNVLPSGHAYGDMINVPPLGYSTTGTADHLRPLDHRHGSSVSSIRSRTPPLNASSHANEDPIVLAAAIPSRLETMVGIDRRKAVDLMGPQVVMGPLDLLGDPAVEYGASSSNAASPGADHGSHSSGIVAELDLALCGGCTMPTSSIMTIPLPGPVRAAIPRYIEVYWALVDPVLTLVHRPSFETAAEDLLRCAMAAVATQHLDSREDRTRGNQLHEFAWQEVKRVPGWSLQTMQAILLCEYFSRFRGRKAVTRPSKPFESLYSRVLCQNPANLDHAVLAAHQQHIPVQNRWQSWVESESRRRLLAACAFCDGHSAIYQQQRRAQDNEAQASAALLLTPLFGRSARLWGAPSAEEWDRTLADDPDAIQPEHVPPLEYLTTEDVLRRPAIDRMIILTLLALQLPRRQRPPPVASLSASNSPVPELDPYLQHGGRQFNPEPHPFLLRHHRQQLESHLDAEERIKSVFGGCPVANTYLALHHTPLRDLLAVAGDSWVFSQKVLPATSFHEHQRRLRMWVGSSGNGGDSSSPASLSVARATVHAARAILGFLGRDILLHPRKQLPVPGSEAVGPPGGIHGSGHLWHADMSDYWAMFVCALICWAFGHRASRGGLPDGSNAAQQQQQQHTREQSKPRGSTTAAATETLGISSGTGSGASSPAPPPPSRPGSVMPVAGDDEAIAWLRMVAAEDTRLEDLVRVRSRREAAGVVGLVRRRLEGDCLGGRSRLYVDAVGVLRKMEEGAGWKWF